MKPPDNLAVLFRGATEYLREIRGLLEQGGLRSWTGPLPPDAPGRPPKAWLGVASEDVARAMAIYEAHQDALLESEQAKAATRKVADFDAAETECPACGTKFATKGAERCPDCGLRFG